MAKYKLIKYYPGVCTPVGTICDEDYYFNDFSIQISKYPEFWEKVEEKEYEILELANKDGDKINTKGCSDEFIEYILRNNKVNIRSIKRLSDGEVFTIGDRITGQYYGKKEPIRIIESFVPERGEFMVKQSFGHSRLSGIKKVKEPLFKTEDGVDIYYGDRYYFYNSDDLDCTEPYDDYAENIDNRRLWNNYKCFSTKEKAQEYINSKKVLFTTVDGVDIKAGDYLYVTSFTGEVVYKEGTKAYMTQEITGKVAYSTKEAAEEALIMNKACLSINDIAVIIGQCNETKRINLDKLTAKLKKLVKSK